MAEMASTESPEADDALLVDHSTSPSLTLPHSSLPPPVVDPGFNQSRRSHYTSVHRSRSSGRGQSQRNRSSNGNRSRSRHRHTSSRRHCRHRCRSYFKHNERNFAAASCSMVAIVLLCTSLEPNWIKLTGGDCHLLHDAQGSLHSLSTRQFFYNGHFYKNYPMTNKGDQVYKYGEGFNDIMVNCVTYSTVILFKASIAFTLLAVVFSFVAFLLDLFGPTYPVFKMLRRNAIFNILTVVMCVTVNLFAFWITTYVQGLQMAGGRVHPGSRVDVTFDVSFYLMTTAGGMSVLATACNCLRRPKVYGSEQFRHRNLYFDDTEALLGPTPDTDMEESVSPLSNLPPPPPYTP